ncbi:MAG: MFS transporter [Dehalococcoidia bacterium]|nr:MFS transporter [Dehalococcoidia bacterium]
MHRRPKVYRGWWIVLTGFLCQLSLSSSMGWVFSLLILPMEADLGWSRAELVGVLTLALLINGVLSAVLGPAVDRHGPRLLMTIGASVGGACLLLVSAVSAPWQYYLLLGIGFGLAETCLFGLGPVAAIANWFIRKRAQAFTISTLGSPIAGILLVPAVAWLVSLFGWRAGWVTLGLIMWSIVPLSWAFVRRRPEDVGLVPDGKIAGSESTAETTENPEASIPNGEPHWTVSEVLHNKSFWLLVAAMSLFGLAGNGFFVHIIPFVVEKGLSPSVGAFAMSLFGFAVLVGRFVWGFAVVRLGIRSPLLSFGLFYGLSLYLFTQQSSEVGILAATTLMGFAAAAFPLFQSQVFPDYFGRQIVGSIMGYAGIFITVARAVSPLFAAILHDSTHSYQFAFSIFAFAFLVGSIAVFLVPSTQARSERQVAGQG